MLISILFIFCLQLMRLVLLIVNTLVQIQIKVNFATKYIELLNHVVVDFWLLNNCLRIQQGGGEFTSRKTVSVSVLNDTLFTSQRTLKLCCTCHNSYNPPRAAPVYAYTPFDAPSPAPSCASTCKPPAPPTDNRGVRRHQQRRPFKRNPYLITFEELAELKTQMSKYTRTSPQAFFFINIQNCSKM